MSECVVIAHNIRSIHNVGAIFRTCEGFGIDRLILSGYTPHPYYDGDRRLPHISRAMTERINKTALGAESLLPWSYEPAPDLARLKEQGFTIIGLEQDDRAITLPDVPHVPKFALLLGEEVEGLNSSLRNECDMLVEISMQGQKESFNVSVATGIALYALTTLN
jgi:23S rRNA (guanosine2251-2'-O)-methyltransferase